MLNASNKMISKLLLLVLTLLSICSIKSFAQNDLILMRDGTEKNVRVVTVTKDKTFFYDKGKKEESVSNELVYMIKYKQRGNVFFTETGERITGGGVSKIPTGAAVIYLTEGKELIGYNISMDENKVTFTETKKLSSPVSYIAKYKIFLIKYPDGTKDILNDLEAVKRKKEELEKVEKEYEELKAKKEKAQQFPRNVIIKTVKENEIRAVLQSDDGNIITFNRAEAKDGPLYNMKKINIKEIIDCTDN